MWSNWPIGFGEDQNVISVQMTDTKWWQLLIRPFGSDDLKAKEKNLIKEAIMAGPPVLYKCHHFLLFALLNGTAVNCMYIKSDRQKNLRNN